VHAGLSFLWVVAFLGHYNEKVNVHVPICRGCLEGLGRRQRRSKWVGAAIGLFLGLLIAPAIFFSMPRADHAGLFFLAGMVTMIAAWVGYMIGGDCARFPVQACYSSRNNTVALRFRRSDYADAVGALASANRPSYAKTP
jgi:hypothetical protein